MPDVTGKFLAAATTINHAEDWYEIDVDLWKTLTREHFSIRLPTVEEQDAWMREQWPKCFDCTYYSGVVFRPAAKIKAAIKCDGCTNCGQKEVTVLQPCPLQQP